MDAWQRIASNAHVVRNNSRGGGDNDFSVAAVAFVGNNRGQSELMNRALIPVRLTKVP